MSEDQLRETARTKRTRRGVSRGSRLLALGAAAVCGLLAIFLGLNARDASLLREANEHGAAKRYSQALTTSRRITRAPQDARALVVSARALTLLGRVPDARKAWAAAARRDPNNWQIQVEWGRLLLFTGDLAGARRRFDRARELNPLVVP